VFFIRLARFRLDCFVISLAAVVFSVTLLPCSGTAAEILHWLGLLAISSLFFLQGARLSSEAVPSGAMHWHLHSVITSTTFVIFVAIGALLSLAVPELLTRTLWVGLPNSHPYKDFPGSPARTNQTIYSLLRAQAQQRRASSDGGVQT
jgi:predicted Na+-dependent transporter